MCPKGMPPRARAPGMPPGHVLGPKKVGGTGGQWDMTLNPKRNPFMPCKCFSSSSSHHLPLHWQFTTSKHVTTLGIGSNNPSTNWWATSLTTLLHLASSQQTTWAILPRLSGQQREAQEHQPEEHQVPLLLRGLGQRTQNYEAL
jgi:hypothetical protein